VDRAEIDVLSTLDGARLPQLMQLYAQEWWTARRTHHDVAAMVEASDVVVGLVHRPTDRLVGFARAITDRVFVAVVLDVIVAPAERGSGLGALLMNTVLDHPLIRDVQSVELTCQSRLFDFYRRWGFTDQVGGSRLMRRTADPALLGRPTDQPVP
jgi:GNAT superfamily N-acetyltransferase